MRDGNASSFCANLGRRAYVVRALFFSSLMSHHALPWIILRYTTHTLSHRILASKYIAHSSKYKIFCYGKRQFLRSVTKIDKVAIAKPKL